MIIYTVYYKKRFFWHKIKKVKGDGLLENGQARFFILEDETRIEIPCQNTIFKFSKERFYGIKERLSQETGQDIKVNKR
jgi:hypothetical protein